MIQVNVRIDEDLKAKADALFDDLGLNMTTAIIMFLKASIRKNGIPFDITRETMPVLDEQLIEAIQKSNIEHIKLETDTDGNIIIDKDLHPDIYDWAVNG